jgi:signal transduction histidine kinase
VQRIVDEHGGMVVASTREGGGASMVVTLPVAVAGDVA